MHIFSRYILFYFIYFIYFLNEKQIFKVLYICRLTAAVLHTCRGLVSDIECAVAKVSARCEPGIQWILADSQTL